MKEWIAVFLMAGAVTASAEGPNVSGKWIMDVPARAGQTRRVTLILNHVGGEVTGTITAAGRPSSASPVYTEVLGGRVRGDTVSFYVWEGTDRPAKVIYEGKILGDEITFVITGGPITYDARGNPNPPPGPRKVTARRSK